MRYWGIVITLFYALIVASLMWLGGFLAEYKVPSLGEHASFLGKAYAVIPFMMLLAGQALLIFLSVDITWQRLKPRQHVLVSAATVGLMVGILSLSTFYVVAAAVNGDGLFDDVLKPAFFWSSLPSEDFPAALWIYFGAGSLLALWMVWGYLFYVFHQGSSVIVERAIGWLMAGSVLELLIAVPCHIIVRNRGDCSAPFVTGYGIATGIAVMLMSFGPGVIFLYQKRMRQYQRAIKPGGK